jgi:dihydropteroate synthase
MTNFVPEMRKLKDRNIQIMGIVNITDDSYFSDSRCTDVQAALDRIGMLLDEGADIIDIGACSTRPGSLPVGAEEEWRRLEPVLRAVKERFPGILLSIDTYWASVVEKAYGIIGPFIVNDISAGEDDPQMLPTVGRLGLQYIAMHKKGTPENMHSNMDYDDVVGEIIEYFDRFAEKAEAFGISDWVADPGFGFSKTVEQNYEILKNLGRFKSKVLVGVSRKSMIYKYLGITPEESLPATQVVHLAGLQGGADILRVHDVAEAVRTVRLYRIIS